MRALIYLALCGSLVGIIQAYKYFQDQIPNGENVPHPCLENHIWKGVGHMNRFGGGPRNPFGLDFADNEYKWDINLCMKDSDGDEKTNGEELGDPDCTWTPSTAPVHKLQLSHPGICEPIDSPKCKKINMDWDFCDQKDFSCPEINSPGAQNITLKIKATAVPPTETNYFCQTFDLPNDTDYHIFATQPALDNANVIHHMLLLGCGDDTDIHLEKFRSPAQCSMQVGTLCSAILALWTVGQVGTCGGNLPAGVRFGKTAVSKVLLEVHWNNPRLRSDYTDGSGLTVHFTPNLKPYDMGMFVIGQMGLRIPAGRVSFYQEATCSSSCTQTALNHTLKIVTVIPHMHYLGRGAYMDQYRNGVRVKTLLDEDAYSYDSPNPVSYLPPVDLIPGDELKVRCAFKSTSNSNAVYYGESTQDEMCFMFINYYPVSDFEICLKMGTYESCGYYSEASVIDGCDFSKLLENLALYGQLFSQCDISGKECKPTCLSLLTDNPQPCLKGSAKIAQEIFGPRVLGDFGMKVQRALRSCDGIIYGDYKVYPESSGTISTVPNVISFLVSMAIAMFGVVYV